MKMLTLEQRCKLATDCLPVAEYRTRLEALHAELLGLRKDTDIHSCNYFCDRPACITAQRDELRAKHAALTADYDVVSNAHALACNLHYRTTEQLDALRQDAARLDWLLDNALVIHMRHAVPTPSTMDRAGIDAAMGQS